MIFRKTLGNDDDEENENDEFEAERQGMGRCRLFGLFILRGYLIIKQKDFVSVIYRYGLRERFSSRVLICMKTKENRVFYN